MNLLTKVRYLLACIAATGGIIAISANTGSSGNSKPNPTFASDILTELSSGNTTSEAVMMGGLIGVENVTIPRDKYVDQGYAVVAPLEDRCVVMLNTKDINQLGGGNLSMLVITKYDAGPVVTTPFLDMTGEELEDKIDEFRWRCRL